MLLQAVIRTAQFHKNQKVYPVLIWAHIQVYLLVHLWTGFILASIVFHAVYAGSPSLCENVDLKSSFYFGGKNSSEANLVWSFQCTLHSERTHHGT